MSFDELSPTGGDVLAGLCGHFQNCCDDLGNHVFDHGLIVWH